MGHQGYGQLAGGPEVHTGAADVGFLSPVGPEVSEVEGRHGEQASHDVVAVEGHTYDVGPEHVAHGCVAGQGGVGEGGEVVHEFQVEHVQVVVYADLALARQTQACGRIIAEGKSANGADRAWQARAGVRN